MRNLLRRDALRLVAEFLATIPAKDRRLIQAWLEAGSVQEAAQQLDVPAHAIKNAMRRARQKAQGNSRLRALVRALTD
jgi:DNA-directed RNA polymerase specialized sigma24 family protein